LVIQRLNDHIALQIRNVALPKLFPVYNDVFTEVHPPACKAIPYCGILLTLAARDALSNSLLVPSNVHRSTILTRITEVEEWKSRVVTF
jgi:hypothetical protein